MGCPHDHSSGPETASRGAHLRLVSCSAPFRSESWSACFLRIWVRASRTSTSLAHKRHLCLEPVARPPPPGGQEQAGQPSGWGPGQASAPFLGSRVQEPQPERKNPTLSLPASLPPLWGHISLPGWLQEML